MKRATGNYSLLTIAEEKIRAFVPYPLPPVSPPLVENAEVTKLIVQAERKLAGLKIATALVPSPDLFAYAFVRKEAVFSSQIEGIQATLSDLLNYEASPDETNETPDVLEVCNYLDALAYGKKQLADQKGLPLSLRLIREMHKRLMRKGRGATKNPGEFRTTQNWIGETRPGNAHFVPPPPDKLNSCLNDLETFLHDPQPSLDPLVRIGLVHVQFETIHPFLDGNGRMGRLLIALLLEAWCGLDARLLYLSLFFKRNQERYYERLDLVRTEGDWEGWILFFLEGICQAAHEAVETAQKIFCLFESDRKQILKVPSMAIPAIRLFEELPNHPVISIASILKLLKTTKPTAGKAVDSLVRTGILKETTGAKRNRLFAYKGYLDILKGD